MHHAFIARDGADPSRLAGWRSLERRIPTSDVLCHRVGTTSPKFHVRGAYIARNPLRACDCNLRDPNDPPRHRSRQRGMATPNIFVVSNEYRFALSSEPPASTGWERKSFPDGASFRARPRSLSRTKPAIPFDRHLPSNRPADLHPCSWFSIALPTSYSSANVSRVSRDGSMRCGSSVRCEGSGGSRRRLPPRRIVLWRKGCSPLTPSWHDFARGHLVTLRACAPPLVGTTWLEASRSRVRDAQERGRLDRRIEVACNAVPVKDPLSTTRDAFPRWIWKVPLWV